MRQTHFQNTPLTYRDANDDEVTVGPDPVHVFEPGGPAAARIDGGRCNDQKRPTVFIAHGLSGTEPNESYSGLVHHLVSVGNIVVYPTYNSRSGSLQELQALYRYVDAGMAQAARSHPRIDTKRIGWWGHSLGGSMIPYLVQQGGLVRRWGQRAIWMSTVAPTFTLLVTPDPKRRTIRIPARTQVLTVGFQNDALADNRIGIEVFDALSVAPLRRRHATVNTDVHGRPPFLADHHAPGGGNGQAIDAVDVALWRYHDLLETCALTGTGCDADFSYVGTWSDGTDIVPATVVHRRPVDVGPYPAALAECDGLYGQQLNQDRMKWCPPTHTGVVS